MENKFKFNITNPTAEAGKSPVRVSMATLSSGVPESGGPSTVSVSMTSAASASEQLTPDVQKGMGGLSLTEEEKLLRTPPKEKTVKEDTPVMPQPFLKYVSKAEKRRAKALRRRAAMAGTGSGGLQLYKAGDAEPGPSNRAAKMKRQSTDEGRPERPPAKRPNQAQEAAGGSRSVAKANRGLAVAIECEDGASVDEALASLIRDKLTQLIELVILRIDEGEVGLAIPRFVASGLVSEGFFLVTPRTTETREWLLSQNFGELGGHSIRVRKFEQTKVAVWIPGKPGTEHVKKFLYVQNPDRPELRIKDWREVGKKALPAGTLLTYVVPEGVEEVWGEEKTKVLDFSATTVTARIQRANPNPQPSGPKQVEPAPLQGSAGSADVRIEGEEYMDVADSELPE